MPTVDKYIFLPSFSLEPNKVTAFNSVFIRNQATGIIKSIHDFKKTRVKTNSPDHNTQVLERKSHNYKLSANAYRTLKRRINWLYYLAKSKRVKTYSGKEIYNFKINFITLTLPSKQLTPTKEVTKALLNPFFTELKQRTALKNYVWRLEFQKNGNVHYHIVTDTYLDYYLILKIWNRLLKNAGYIAPYKAKFENMSLLQYRDYVDKEQKTPFNDIVKRYAKGKAQKWEQPPSVDVKSVISNKVIANYISKYFSKENDENPEKNELDNDENSANMRLWFCSSALSRLKTISDFCEAVTFDIFAIVSHAETKRKVVMQYAQTTYFEIASMKGKARTWIEKFLKSYATKQGYVPALE